MNYIKDFAVVRLKKNATVEFFEYLMTLIEMCESLKTNLPEQYAAIKAASEELLKLGEVTQKSNLTQKIHDLDFQRDSYLIALEHALKALVTSLDPEIREQAIAVKNKYDSINVPRSAQYFQESGAIDRLLGALLGEELLAEVTTIGVLPIVNMLKAANDEMHRLLVERGIDEAKIPEQAFENARRHAEDVYRDFVFMVNAYIAMYVERANQPDADLETFVQNLNQFLHKYRITQFPNSGSTKPGSGAGAGSEEDSENSEGSEDSESSEEDNNNNNNTPGGGGSTLTPDENPPGQNPNPTPGEGNGENEDEYTPPDNDGGFGG